MFIFLFLLFGMTHACNDTEILSSMIENECPNQNYSSPCVFISDPPSVLEYCSLDFKIYWHYYYYAACDGTTLEECDFYDSIENFTNHCYSDSDIEATTPYFLGFIIITVFLGYSILRSIRQTRINRNQTRINSEFTSIELSPFTQTE